MPTGEKLRTSTPDAGNISPSEDTEYSISVEEAVNDLHKSMADEYAGLPPLAASLESPNEYSMSADEAVKGLHESMTDEAISLEEAIKGLEDSLHETDEVKVVYRRIGHAAATAASTVTGNRVSRFIDKIGIDPSNPDSVAKDGWLRKRFNKKERAAAESRKQERIDAKLMQNLVTNDQEAHGMALEIQKISEAAAVDADAIAAQALAQAETEAAEHRKKLIREAEDKATSIINNNNIQRDTDINNVFNGNSRSTDRPNIVNKKTKKPSRWNTFLTYFSLH